MNTKYETPKSASKTKRSSSKVKCGKCQCMIEKSNVKHFEYCKYTLGDLTCPICLDEIKNRTYVIFKCGHLIHEDCKKNFFNAHKIHCPTCRRVALDEKSPSIQKYYQDLDNYVLNNPEENGEKKIFCIECQKNSVVNYHSQYNRCGHCQSYNTYLDDVRRQLDFTNV